MHSIASGSAAAVGLVGTAPAEDPESIPDSSSYPAYPAPPADELVAEVKAHSPRRLVVRLLGGEEIELGGFDDRDGAVEAAHELVARFSSAEASGEWPEVDGHFLRPASIASIDVLVRD
jgi:hypothetical protein